MPPKQQPSKKTEQKRKEKVIEDKTFGLKNKKGTKNQKYVQQVQNQVINQIYYKNIIVIISKKYCRYETIILVLML